MLLVASPLGTIEIVQPITSAAGFTFIEPQSSNSYPGSTGGSNMGNVGMRHLQVELSIKSRWRASKGSAPVNRFTRAISDNTTEGWHRSMPVADQGVTSILIAASFAAAVLTTLSIEVEKLLQSSIAVSVSASQSTSIEKPVESSMSLAVLLSDTLATVVFFLREYEEEFHIRRIFR